MRCGWRTEHNAFQTRLFSICKTGWTSRCNDFIVWFVKTFPEYEQLNGSTNARSNANEKQYEAGFTGNEEINGMEQIFLPNKRARKKKYSYFNVGANISV